MKNDLQKLMEDIFRLYGDINQRTGSLDRITQIGRLYEELDRQLQDISAAEVDHLQTQIQSTLERLMTLSESIELVKALKVTLEKEDENLEVAKKG
jgi:hypothetical protein